MPRKGTPKNCESSIPSATHWKAMKMWILWKAMVRKRERMETSERKSPSQLLSASQNESREKERKFSAKNFLPLMRRMVLLINVRRMRNDATFHRARYLVAFEPANRKNRTTVRWRKFVKKRNFLC